MSDNFYRAFEEKHRGSRELIKERLRAYLAFVEPLKSIYPNFSCIDLGCGRGEWLELMMDSGARPFGIDLDEGMLRACQDMGLPSMHGDCISWLSSLPDESQAVVSAFHLVEHISFEQLQSVVRQALRVLKPGGLLIMETPNPENIRVATANFYLDPSHQRPIPSQLLAFLPELYGYFRSKVLYLQESKELVSSSAPTLLDVLVGVSPDYGVVAQKSAVPDITAQFDAAYACEYGLTLDALARRFDNRMQLVEQKARWAERNAWEAEKKVLRTEKKSLGAEQKAWWAEKRVRRAEKRVREVEKRLRELEHVVHDVNGRSYGIKYWLHSLEEKKDNIKQASKSVLRSLLIPIALYVNGKPFLNRMLIMPLNKFPNARQWIKRSVFGKSLPSDYLAYSQYRSRKYTLGTIAVDLTPVLPGGDNGGAKVFVLELLRVLAEMKPHISFILLTQDSSHEELALMDRSNMRRIKVLDASHSSRVSKYFLSDLNIDLLFCPFTAPTYAETGIPVVCTVYDLQYRTYPEFFAPEDVAHRDRVFRDACKKATILTAISDYSRDTAIEHGKIEPERIGTIYLRMARRISYELDESDDNVLSRLRVASGRYLIYPANFWKHKNHEMLLTAFGIACNSGIEKEIKLVCTGAPGERQEWLKRAARAMGLDERVIFPGYLPNDELAVLMANAVGMVFPSLYEGFGLPVIEAMAFGIPVACSNTRSLPEVAGDAALLFDPRSPEKMAESIISLTTDHRLREQLVRAGQLRAAEFSDSRQMAMDYWALFQKAAGAADEERNYLSGVWSDEPQECGVRQYEGVHGRSDVTVSIITPSYNQGPFIERTLMSVALQSGAEIEHMVVDGGSTDNTIDILRRFTPKVHWVSEKDDGQADAVNKGIRSTAGDIIGWLNSDDIYYPGAISRVLAFFREHPEVDIVYGGADHIDINDEPFEAYPTEPWNFDRLHDICFICQPALFFRRSIVEKYGLLDDSLQYCMDYEYWLRLGQAGVRFAYLPEKLAGSRMYAENKTLGSRVKVHAEINDMFKKCFGQVPKQWLHNYAIVSMQRRTGMGRIVKIEHDVRYLFAKMRWKSVSMNL